MPAETDSSPTSQDVALGPDVARRAQPNDPLHGITLEALLTDLVSHFGWEELGYRIRINCFVDNPSIKSSLKFLRKTPWAREKVEKLYLSLR